MATYEELRRHIDAAYALLPEFQERLSWPADVKLRMRSRRGESPPASSPPGAPARRLDPADS